VTVPTASAGNVCVWKQCRSEFGQQYGQCAPGLECVGSNGYYAQCREPPYIDGCAKSNDYCTADGDCCGEYSECRSNQCTIPCGAEHSVAASASHSSGSTQSSGLDTTAVLTALAVAAALLLLAAAAYYYYRKRSEKAFICSLDVEGQFDDLVT
jgi:hypothetical protein